VSVALVEMVIQQALVAGYCCCYRGSLCCDEATNASIEVFEMLVDEIVVELSAAASAEYR
jgi:hypothetical protein